MPEHTSPSGDDWASSPSPGPGAQPPQGSGSFPGSSGSTPAGGSNAGWNTPGWDPPAGQSAGVGNWGAPAGGGPGAGPGSFGGWPQPTGFAGAPPDVLPGNNSGGDGGGSVGPPSWILLVGLAVPLAIIPLLLLDGIWLHVVGWVVAIFGSVGALAAFTAVDLRRRSSRWYVDQPALLAGLRVAVLVTGLVVASCFAYQIADVVARWDRWS